MTHNHYRELPHAWRWPENTLAVCPCDRLYVRRTSFEGVPVWKRLRWYHWTAQSALANGTATLARRHYRG